EKSAYARRQLTMVITIVALQAVFDFMTPQVSFVGHLSGAILGFLTATLLLSTMRRPVRSKLQPVRMN
ncbi:MAG TPA: rhomboid family intramembrane serine protease, partial [Armatimonadota bacterium]